ncbi:hypothetical protein ONZ45_g6737 [Pleurotus djamor]|nr:hypothetical protein ONZ45_g6737 [Pleurotus djamor]
MAKKNNKAKKRAAAAATSPADAAPEVVATSSGEGETSTNGRSSSSSPVPEVPSEDPIALAEQTKEKGNAAFKGASLDNILPPLQHISFDSELNPNEPAYLTNRAASYMALKRFRPALQDCQTALALQPTDPPPTKTLIRLVKCQLALGQPEPALSSLRPVLSAEPNNAAAQQLSRQIAQLQSHLENYSKSRAKGDWGMARLALEKCFQAVETEASENPMEWRLWKAELELARGAMDTASASVNDALRLNPNSPDILALRGLILFISGKLPQATQNVTSALRLDPEHPRAQKLRKRIRDVERLKDEGNQHFKLGSHQQAIEKYSEALERIGEADDECKGGHIRAMLLSNRATTLLKLDKFQEALEDTTKSIELNDTSFKVHRTRARIQLALDAFEDAVRDFKRAIELAKGDGLTGPADVRQLQGELRKAEIALKQSKTKDYYGILGLKRDCTQVEVKKAYRKESLIHHPDKGGDEEKFKLVVEAHAVLSDPQRRERYDNGEDDDSHGGDPFGGGFAGADISEIFAQFGGGGGFGGFGGGGFPGGGFHSHGGGGGRRQHSHGFGF